MDKDKKIKQPSGEDYTKYGEFISSFDRWISPEQQKETAKKLEQKIGD